MLLGQIKEKTIYVRCSIHQAKSSLVLDTWSIVVVAGLDFLLEILMDGAGVISNFQHSHTRDAKQLVLIEDVAKFVLWNVAVIVPGLPVEAINQSRLGELNQKEGWH